jgi:hypothetical protein
MTEPKPTGDVLSGRDEATPVRAFNRVALVIFVVFVVVCGVSLVLWATLNN